MNDPKRQTSNHPNRRFIDRREWFRQWMRGGTTLVIALIAYFLVQRRMSGRCIDQGTGCDQCRLSVACQIRQPSRSDSRPRKQR
ncbi:Mtc1 family protein [Crateriforma conspicua]|uniref:Mtc1 family protein n=1 Tax=Crateriforma conspicua TaxID=2527996 RepID=UPI0013FD08E8|nr:Mtc1 family protein [Crateriforma conspicua]